MSIFQSTWDPVPVSKDKLENVPWGLVVNFTDLTW